MKKHSSSIGARITSGLLLVCTLLVGAPATRAQEPEYEQTPREQAQILTAQAVEKFNQGQFDEALQVLEQSVQIAEPVYQTHFWMGRVYATRAGTSPTARSQAIKHFHRALQLQPFGEEGDLARGWVARFDGRPQRVMVAAVQDRVLKTYDSNSTDAVVNMVLATAGASGLPTTRNTGGPIQLWDWTPDSLNKLCQDDEGKLVRGWFIGIAVESVEGAKSKAKVWVYDPLAKQLYDPTDISTSFDWPKMILKNSNAPTTGDTTLDDLSLKIWQRCRPVVAGQPDLTVLDEVQFPSEVSGIYVRSTIPYEEAQKQPLMLLAPVHVNDKEDQDTARELGTNLQQSILAPGRFSLISPGGASSIAKKLSLDPEKTMGADWQRVGEMAHSRYVTVATLSRFDLKIKTVLFITTVKVNVALQVTVVDCATGQPVLSREYKKDSSSTKIASDGMNALFKKRNEILQGIIKEASSDIQMLPA